MASRRANVPPALMTAIVVVESAGRPDAVSQAGAQGLAQLMPGTAERFGVRNAFDPAQNLRGASSYLSFVLRRFRNDWVLALAAYNAGEGAVDKHGGVPPFRETRAYIPKVLSAYALLTTMISQDEAKQYDWFWKAVPAKLKAGKRSDALNVVRDEQARGRKVFGSQRSIGRILKKWRKPLQQAAQRSKVSEALLAAIVSTSGGNPRSVSPMGAQGLGQLMPDAARKYRVKDPLDPAQSIFGSAAYLSDLINTFRGDLVLALAAYSAGLEAVKGYGGIPPLVVPERLSLRSFRRSRSPEPFVLNRLTPPAGNASLSERLLRTLFVTLRRTKTP